jgi:CHAT domain-containing protein
VINELQSKSYDVLHFAGHCRYDPRTPRASGLVFSNEEVLTAGDIGQLRPVPSFVFANACYSGLLPDHPRQYSARFTPSLAAAFIRGGVGNLVCAAWQVNTQVGLLFAVTLYQNLLGINGPPQPMHAAMRRARVAVSKEPNGLQTWGAYQHYGKPYFRFFRE